MNNFIKKLSLSEYVKLLGFTFIVLLLAYRTSLPVFAKEADTETVSANTVSASDTEDTSLNAASTTVYTVISIENSDLLYNLEPFEIVRRSSQDTNPLLYHVYNNNLLKVNASIQDSDGNISTKALNVLWSFQDDATAKTNTTVSGEYTEIGTILLPDASYVWDEGVSSTLNLPVKVYDPEEPIEIVELEEIWNEFDIALSLEQNHSPEDVLSTAARQTTWPCYDAAGNEYICPVIYNTENVREDTVGISYITAVLEEPLNCRFSDSLTVPSFSIPVTVQAPGQPLLNLLCLSANYELIVFPWITSGIDLDTMEVWMSENNGEWRMLESGWDVEIYSTMLGLYTWSLTEGSSYRIQVDYEGGQTGIASFTYEYGMLSDQKYVEGDRDGGDTNGNMPNDSDEEADSDEKETNADEKENDVNANDASTDTAKTDTPIQNFADETLPAPDTDQLDKVPSVTNEPPQATDNEANENIHTSTDSSATANRKEPYLLGSEINLMIKNLGAARFSGGNIMLNIPADTIESLNIKDNDRFLAAILPLEDNGFSINIFINDIAVTTLSTMQISLPYIPKENTTPVLINEDGKEIVRGYYEQNTGLVTFSIQETGIFYIQDNEVSSPDSLANMNQAVIEASTSDTVNSNHVSKLIIIILSIISCTVALIFYFFKKRMK